MKLERESFVVPDGYLAQRLSKRRDAGVTLFRQHPKPVKGKAAVKAAKRARHAARNRA